MNFQDIGIIISKKPLKEHLYLLAVFTKYHGLYTSVARTSSKSAAIYCEGNLINFIWKARLLEHIGSAKCELIKSYSSYFMMNKTKLYAFNSIISLIKIAFHEREPHYDFFLLLDRYLSSNITNFDIRLYINVELEILRHAGYGLQLVSCVVTGDTDDLCYVSPKSGNAVSRSAGRDYADKLLAFPKILLNLGNVESLVEVTQALNLTSYFLDRYIYRNNQQPEARSVFIEHILSLYNN